MAGVLQADFSLVPGLTPRMCDGCKLSSSKSLILYKLRACDQKVLPPSTSWFIEVEISWPIHGCYWSWLEFLFIARKEKKIIIDLHRENECEIRKGEIHQWATLAYTQPEAPSGHIRQGMRLGACTWKAGCRRKLPTGQDKEELFVFVLCWWADCPRDTEVGVAKSFCTKIRWW